MVGGSRQGTHKNWATKVKTGCLTCKRRRIKCDETKPSCRRCATHRVVCEGYPDLSYRPPGTQPVSIIPSSSTTHIAENISSISVNSNVSAPPAPSFAARHESLVLRNSRDAKGAYTQLNLPGHTIYPYVVSNPINSWTETFSPYTTPEQRLAIAAWTELAPSMSRSQDGLDYWNVIVPTISWGHSSVRNALMAASTIFHSLRRKDDPDQYEVAETRAVGYANKCIRELVSGTAPPEAVIASATLFWIFEMMSGNWTNSLTHLAASFRISKSTEPDSVSEPSVPQYITSFVGGLPTAINPESIVGMPRKDQLSQANARHRYARPIMRDALSRLESFQQKLRTNESVQKDHIVQALNRSAGELDKMYQRWPVRIDHEDDTVVIQQVVNKHSPFIRVIKDAEIFLVDDKVEHIEEFVTDFRSSIDHYIWLGACLTLYERQRMIEIWTVARSPHSFDESFIATSSG